MKSFDHITRIEKVSGISRKEFLEKYVSNSLPVVICDKPDWKAFDKFTPDFFKQNYGHLNKTIDGKTYSMAEILDLSMASTPENKSPYPCVFDIHSTFPELFSDLRPDLIYGKQNRLYSKMLPGMFYRDNAQFGELFFGGKGCSFPYVHIDHLWVNTQITQIIGDKEFFLYPPDQTPYMYPKPENRRDSAVDIHDPDYTKFPLFKNARALRVVVHPGESIFMPSGWWHTTYIHNFNLSYALDHLNSRNWNAFMNEVYIGNKNYHPKLGWLIKFYQFMAGRVFNLQEFFMKP
jgi:histone arginine demethylase JMJD6